MIKCRESDGCTIYRRSALGGSRTTFGWKSARRIVLERRGLRLEFEFVGRLNAIYGEPVEGVVAVRRKGQMLFKFDESTLPWSLGRRARPPE